MPKNIPVRQVITHHGRVMEAIDPHGRRIYREDKLYLDSHKTWYEVMPYDTHFIYKARDVGPGILCTCGSMAIVVNYDVYKAYHDNHGAMLVCMSHMSTGKHADGSS